MNLKLTILALTLGCCTTVFAGNKTQSKNDTLYAEKLKPIGRYQFTAKHQLELIGSAVHFGFSFEGKQCTIYTELTDRNSHNFIQYELDGVYQKNIRVEGSTTDPIIINVPNGGKHRVWIYKTTEATTGAVYITKIAATVVKPLTVAKAPMIEFIGNSITCGAQSDSTSYPCNVGQYHDHHNAYMAYGPSVARTLGASYMLSSVSGIGAYRTWNTDGPAMPQVYENADLHANSAAKWNFSLYKPKVVSIALGTNDLSTGDGKTPRQPFSSDTFIASYVKFVRLVKSKYPKATIALLSSPMVKGSNRVMLEHCLTEIKAQIDAAYPDGKPVETFFFEPFEAHGCGGHPSVAEQQIMAKQLEPFFKKLIQ